MLQCAVGYPITMEHQVDNMVFSLSMKEKMRIIIEHYAARTQYKSYGGMETVFFKNNSLRGSFKHSGDRILNININFTSHKELPEALSYIAEYVRYEWKTRRKKTNREMRFECRRKVRSQPWRFLKTNQAEWESISINNLPRSVSFMHLNQNTE